MNVFRSSDLCFFFLRTRMSYFIRNNRGDIIIRFPIRTPPCLAPDDVPKIMPITICSEKTTGLFAALDHVHWYRAQELDNMGYVVLVFVVSSSGMRIEQKVTGGQFERL